MTTVQQIRSSLSACPEWASLPLLDRSNWLSVPFGEFAENVNVRIEPPDAAEEPYVGLEHLTSGSLRIRGWGKGSDVIGTKLRFQKGDLIFGRRRAYQRKLAVAEMDGICSAHAMVVRAKPHRILSEFLPFLMMSNRFMSRAVEISVGSLSPTINWTTLKAERFLLPPLDEQRRIATILLASIESTETFRPLDAALRSYQEALWSARTKQPDVKRVPIASIAVVSNGTTPSRAEARYWSEAAIPWLPTGMVHKRFIASADDFVSEAAVRERKSRVFPRGSVLVAMIGEGKTRGSAALLEIDAAINQNFACIVPKTVDSQYLFYCLDLNYAELRAASHGSSQGALNCGVVGRFQIPLLDPGAQVDLGNELRSIDWVRERVVEVRSKGESLVTLISDALIG